MATELQKLANRNNALNSTGPRSLAGKKASSRNALSHGLTARQALLPGENETEWQELRGAIIGKLNPDGVVESQLAERIVSLIWRLRRIPNLEMALFQWVAYQEAALHDGHDLLLEKEEGPEPNHNAEAKVTGDLDDAMRLGRMIESALSQDLIGKFGRYETSLSKQLRHALAELRALKLFVPNEGEPVEPQPHNRFDYLTPDGRLKPP
ncbi:MAG: hypothetical protein ABL907_11455 [Hyphomicrobium sp.]